MVMVNKNNDNDNKKDIIITKIKKIGINHGPVGQGEGGKELR